MIYGGKQWRYVLFPHDEIVANITHASSVAEFGVLGLRPVDTCYPNFFAKSSAFRCVYRRSIRRSL